jgi:thymidylate synthase
MLKEVGASGQISLGKKYAGQLFDMQIAADGSVKLTPVQVVPMKTVAQEEPAVYKVDAADATHLNTKATQEWATTHVQDIAQYNQWATQREPYSQRVRNWRKR